MRSLSRIIVNLASGTAIVESTASIAVAIINSRSVKPRPAFVLRLRAILCIFIQKNPAAISQLYCTVTEACAPFTVIAC
jgi:hypothetical protein